MLAILIAYITKYLISSICFQWANSFVAPTKRAVYSAKKEIISLATGKAFGRYSDKHSYAKGIELAMIIAGIGFLFNAFTVPETKYFIIIYTVLYYVSLAGTNQNSFNITYSYVNAKYTAQAMAIKYSIGGIFGFLASLAGGRILSVVQANNNMVFGIQIYGQQILSLISFLLTVVAIIFTKKVIANQKVMVQ